MEQMTHITNRYSIIEKLGQGGMGTVWRVYDRLEQREVALKQVLLSKKNPHFASTVGIDEQVLLPKKNLQFASTVGIDDSDKLHLSLAQEFSILATLRHPYILSVLDYGFDNDGQPFYTMTLLEGGIDCKTYGMNLATRRRIVLMGQMLQALHYLHRRGVLHRDLKPDNVFVTKDEQIKVMDFGLAKQDKEQSSFQSGTITGTIAYMAPESFQGGQPSVASDLFAVGVMVYEIMVGKHPFDAETIGDRIIKIMTHTPDFLPFHPDFVPWLKRILDKDPSSRYATAYDAMLGFYDAVGMDMPAQPQRIRESFLQAGAFVGREIEFKQLTDALEKIKTENAFFLIGGESGVGKSRLLDELRVRALVSGASVLRGQAVEGGGLPFQLWREIARRLLLMVEVTDLQAGVLKDIVPDMDALMQRELAKVPELTGGAYQERMVLTIVDLFRNLQQPIVLLLEDLQWTNESLAVLNQMLKVREQLPQLIIVASYRDDEALDLPEKLTGMTHIKLERLNADAVSELSSAMLGEGGKNEDVIKLLHSQSEGNVFFLVETVRALAEASGDLQRIGQGKLPEGVFTGGMQAIMRRRLSKVDGQYSAIQTLAAIIGREIDTKLLAHADDEAHVQAWLSNAADYNVVNVQDNRWRFAHDKLREALIADIPDDTLPKLHRTAAETIEAVYPDDAGYNEALLAHWQAAGDLDKTYHYLLPVAKHMIEISGTYTIAEAHLQRMLERLPKDDRRCIVLWNWLADSNSRQGNYSSSQGYAVQAQELATSLDDREGLAASLNNLGYIAVDQGEYARATDLYQQSMVISQQLGDQAGIASSLNNLGNIAESQGEYAHATDLYQQSLAISQQLGNQAGIAASLNSLGSIAESQGEYARATDLYQQSLAIRQQLGDQRGIAASLNKLGNVALDQGKYARATDLYQQSLAIRQQLGNQRGIAINLNNLGIIAINQGGYARATDLFQQSMVIFQQLGNQDAIANCLGNLGLIAESQGEVARATDLYQQSLVIFQQLGEQRGIAICLNNLGNIALNQGEYARATDLYQQSLAIRQQLGDQYGIANSLIGLASAAIKQGEAQAASLYGQALRMAYSIQAIPQTLWATLGLASVILQSGQAKRATHHVGFAQSHPAKDNDVRQALAEIMPLLEAALSPEELQAALERGKLLDLDTVVQELLAEFAPDERP